MKTGQGQRISRPGRGSSIAWPNESGVIRRVADALSIWRDEGGPEGRIALVLSDITMPEMGGAALAAALRSLRPAQAIACMTGYADGVARAEVEALGISFLDKPFTTPALARLVHEQIHGA